MSLRLRLPFFPLIFLACAANLSAATQTLNPVADAFVSSNPALNSLGTASISGSNYGAAGALGVAAAGLSKGEFDSLFRFDFSAAKSAFDSALGTGQWAITSVSFQLTLAAPNNALFNGNGAGAGGTNINFAGLVAAKWLQNDSWGEGSGAPAAPTTTGLTFSTLPNFHSAADESLGTTSFSGATSGTLTLSLGLTPSFTADATGGNLVTIELAPGDSAVAMLADSQNFGTPALRPLLTVIATPVPEPCAGMLLAAGALAGIARRRRHARAA